MTAPLFHLRPGALDRAAPGERIVLDGEEGHHAATVMRLQPGEEVTLSDTRAVRLEGVVLEARPGALVVEVRHIAREPHEVPKLVLVQALAKDRRDLQAVESATELGVDVVIPWQSERSVARWKAGRESKKHAEWLNTVRTAAKQTRRTVVPEVHQLHTTAQYCRRISQMSADAAASVAVVVLHETSGDSLSSVLARLEAPSCEELHLVVGPEGGISPAELERLTASNGASARLGPTVLRSSTAGVAAVTAAQVMLGRWETGVQDGPGGSAVD